MLTPPIYRGQNTIFAFNIEVILEGALTTFINQRQSDHAQLKKKTVLLYRISRFSPICSS